MGLATASLHKPLFSARGFGSGDGGRIHISNAPQVDLKFTSIVATGGDNGIGGVVVVQNAKAFDVNDVIDVAGGDAIATNQFDGSITLNAIKCRQWKTGFDWPKSYWVCNDDDPPSSIDQVLPIRANNLPANVKAELEAGNVQLYMHPDVQSSNAFFNRNDAALEAGITFTNIGFVSIYATVRQSCVDCGTQPGLHTVTEDEMKEVSVHELGHAMDFHFGIENSSGTALYDQYIKQDFLDLDYAVVGASQAQSLPRDPCIPFNGRPAPFSDTINSRTGLPICNGPVLDFTLAGHTNSEILILTEAGIFAKTNEGGNSYWARG